MAIFEKDRGSRRFFSLSTDDRPEAPGGIPGGSILVHTDTGGRFIYNGETRAWLPFVGEEDVVGVLEDMTSVMADILQANKVIRAAIVALANEIPDGERFNPTDDD